jgi:ABC-type uncharacterized transport system permease subunit
MEFLTLISGFVMIALASSTPLILAAMGGLLSEKSGIVNIALEGKMLFGALMAVAVTFWSGSPWLGCLAAMAAGIILALIHLVNCQFLNADHVVSGAAINIFSLGFTGFLVFQIFGSKSSDQVATLPTLDFGNIDVPILKEFLNLMFTGMSPLFIFALLIVVGIHRLLQKTSLGLRVRSIGESPAVAEARGVDVLTVRFICLIASGALAGLAGAQLAVGEIGFFTEKMSAGRGFIALAAVIFGRWKPLPVLAACLFFGFADALALRLKLNFQFVPDELAQALPFILTLIVLAVSKAASGMPTSLGQKAADKHLD